MAMLPTKHSTLKSKKNATIPASDYSVVIKEAN